MNTTVELSPFLQALVEKKGMSLDLAQRLNRLPSLQLQQKAVMELPALVARCADELCERLEHLERTILYDSRASVRPARQEMLDAAAEDLLDRYFPIHGEVGRLLKQRIRQGWRNGWLRRLLVGAVVVWVVTWLWGTVVVTNVTPLAKMAVIPEPVLPPPVESLPDAGRGRRGAGEGKLNKEHPAPAPRIPNPASSLPPPPPRVVHVLVMRPDLIRISWDAVSGDVGYNVYSSASRQLINLRQENSQPIKTTAVEWTPEYKSDRYWVVVTAVDAEGRESNYSEAVEAILSTAGWFR